MPTSIEPFYRLNNRFTNPCIASNKRSTSRASLHSIDAVQTVAPAARNKMGSGQSKEQADQAMRQRFSAMQTKPSPGNITGFSIQDLKTAGSNPNFGGAANDPWMRNEQWRYQGRFSFYNRIIKGTLPGLGIATVAFVTYCVAEAMFFKDDHHHAKEEGGEHH